MHYWSVSKTAEEQVRGGVTEILMCIKFWVYVVGTADDLKSQLLEEANNVMLSAIRRNIKTAMIILERETPDSSETHVVQLILISASQVAAELKTAIESGQGSALQAAKEAAADINVKMEKMGAIARKAAIKAASKKEIN